MVCIGFSRISGWLKTRYVNDRKLYEGAGEADGTMAGRRDAHPQTQAEEPMDLYPNWLDNLRRASEFATVFVQHKHDADVLKSLDIKNVYYYQEPEFKIIEAIVEMGKECILLFDVNRPSNELCERMKSELEQRGVKVNPRFRKVLFTAQFKELGGLLKFLHTHVADSPRKHEGAPY